MKLTQTSWVLELPRVLIHPRWLVKLMRIFKETGDCVNGIEYLFILSKADDLFIILGVWFSYLQVTWSELGEIFRFYCHFYIKEKASSLLRIGKAQRNTASYAFSLATSLPPLCTPPPRKKKRKRKEGQEKKTKPRGSQMNNSKLYTSVMNSQYTGEAARTLLLRVNYCQNISSFAKAVGARELTFCSLK